MKKQDRIALDYVMLLTLLALLLKPLTGVFAHEIMGIGFCALTLIHCRNPKSGIKGAKGAVNLLLGVSLMLVIVSGIMISVSLFRFLGIPFLEGVYRLHVCAAAALFVLALTHLIMHAKMISASFRNRGTNALDPKL